MPSLTVPDETMSVREILYRYARGLGFDQAKVPMYEEEGFEMPDISQMDYSEVQEMLQQAKDDQVRLRSRLNDLKNEKSKSEEATANV